MTEVGVLICDDQELMRAGLCKVLDGQSGLTVVVEAEDGESAVAQALVLRPDPREHRGAAATSGRHRGHRAVCCAAT